MGLPTDEYETIMRAIGVVVFNKFGEVAFSVEMQGCSEATLEIYEVDINSLTEEEEPLISKRFEVDKNMFSYPMIVGDIITQMERYIVNYNKLTT